MTKVILYTDGACSGNPGPGGWAFIIENLATGTKVENSGSVSAATNNQMELEAVIQGLSALTRPCQVELVTDSTYVGNGITSWIHSWKSKGWKKPVGEIKNLEQWQRIDDLLFLHEVTYTKVRAHSGHPENERVDRLAVEACKKAAC